MNTNGHRWGRCFPKPWRAMGRVWLGLLAPVCVLSGCGTTGAGMLGGAVKGAQEHELRQRPLHGNGSN